MKFQLRVLLLVAVMLMICSSCLAGLGGGGQATIGFNVGASIGGRAGVGGGANGQGGGQGGAPGDMGGAQHGDTDDMEEGSSDDAIF